jgi:hypothetical protein
MYRLSRATQVPGGSPAKGHKMPVTHRFGKRIPLPSTRQIRHDLILMWAEDELKKRGAPALAAPETVVKPPEGAAPA